MEQRYKDALQQIYRDKFNLKSDTPTYAEDLYSLRKHYLLSNKGISTNTNKVLKVQDSSPADLTEKKIVLDSFAQYGNEVLANNEEEPVAIEGGEILKKVGAEQSDNGQVYQIKSIHLKELKDKYTQLAGLTLTNTRYKELTENHPIEVMFISDSFISSYDPTTSEDGEFSCLFEGATAKLFSKMVKAMNLKNHDYLLTAVKSDNENDIDCFDLVLQEIETFKPKYIICLGVTASHCLLQSQKRLQEIHGKFFDIQINEVTTQLMPLFSPHLLNTAPNMKKIAWEDMQRVMAKLNL